MTAIGPGPCEFAFASSRSTWSAMVTMSVTSATGPVAGHVAEAVGHLLILHDDGHLANADLPVAGAAAHLRTAG